MAIALSALPLFPARSVGDVVTLAAFSPCALASLGLLVLGARLHGPQILAMLAVSGWAWGLLLGLPATGRR